MLAGSGFVFSGDADSAFTANRAFVFADPAADTAFRIDIRLLEPYLNRHCIPGLRRLFKWKFAVNRQAAGCIGDDSAASPSRVSRNDAKIISGGVLICSQRLGLELDPGGIGRFNNQRMLDADGIEQLPGKDGFRTDRAIFLTDDTRPVHGPGQATAAVDKGSADFYGALFNMPTESMAFLYADGSNCRCRAKMAAGDTVVLTPAGADSKIEHRCPQALQTGCHPGRVDDIGRADAHALAAFYAAR